MNLTMFKRFGIKTLLVVVTLTAIACFGFRYETITIRCDYGSVTIIHGYLAPGSVMDVYGRKSDGKFKLIAEEATVVGEPYWETAGTSVHVVDFKMHICQVLNVRGFDNYRIRPPGRRKARGGFFGESSIR